MFIRKVLQMKTVMPVARMFVIAVVLASATRLSPARADTTAGSAGGDGTALTAESCKALWETIAIDITQDDNRIAVVVKDLQSISGDAGLYVPDDLLPKLKNEIHALMLAVTPICGKVESRQIDSDLFDDANNLGKRYQLISRRVQGDILGNLKLALDYGEQSAQR